MANELCIGRFIGQQVLVFPCPWSRHLAAAMLSHVCSEHGDMIDKRQSWFESSPFRRCRHLQSRAGHLQA